MKLSNRLAGALATAWLCGCASLAFKVDSGVVVPAGGRASARIDLGQTAPLVLDLDVESSADVALKIVAANATNTREISISSSFPPHAFHGRFTPSEGVLTIAVESAQQANVHCHVAAHSGVEVNWLVTADSGKR